jgi:hypothetical protein
MSARALGLLAAALVLSFVVAGCGGDEEGKPLPSAQVQLLDGRLDETQRRLDDGSAGACRDILNDTQPEVGKIIDSLPNDVDADVRDALVESFDNLWSLVGDRCQEAEQEEESQQEQEPEPEPTETEPTETEPTETETTPTETTPPATEELPPEGDGDNGGGVPGNGNGNGNGVGGGISPDGANLRGGE